MEEMGNIRVVLLFKILAMVAAAETWPVSKPGCPDSCDNISIPYPYGIGRGCFRKGFEITCLNNDDGLLRPFSGNIEVINISLPQGEVRMFKHMAFACYDQSGRVDENHTSWWPIDLINTPYRLSDTRNKFTAVGCDTLAYIISNTSRNDYMSGCLAICSSMDSVVNGSCSGIGCCQTSIPKNLDSYEVVFDKDFNHSSVGNFNPCSFAFVADQDWYSFQSSDVFMYECYHRNNKHVPMVLDWAIRTVTTCEEAKRNMTSYACVSNHSQCINSINGPGYLCNCFAGYEGNPYLPNGCQDINECELHKEYPCFGNCTNTPGSYTCLCPPGIKGDPKIKDGCNPVETANARGSKFPKSLQVVTGISISIFFVIVTGFWIYLGLQKRKLIIEKQRFFEQNGGFLLQQQINSHKGVAFKIFTKEEIERATNKFDTDQIIGRGGHGTVYKGVLEDKRLVAIKASKIMDEGQIKEFAKEMFILSQINHKNVVKLLGCCLEVEVPILVYEFVSNGTLFQYIHDKNNKSPRPLDARLRIAMESAQALSYLHSSASPPIIHGDVKPSNILLDETYAAKVSDFGASKLVPTDEVQLATLVQGTCGYLDPEYLQTCQLTEKSDVYSFGVVLVELLTRKKALHFEGSEKERSLASVFMLAMKENRLHEIVDNHVLDEGGIEFIKEIADLAAECLNVRGQERPSMKEVAEELERLRKPRQHPWVSNNAEEMESLLGESTSAPDTMVPDTIQQRAVLSIEIGRG